MACYIYMGGLSCNKPPTNETRNKITNTTKSSLATPVAATAIPQKPNTAATAATTKNNKAHRSIVGVLRYLFPYSHAVTFPFFPSLHNRTVNVFLLQVLSLNKSARKQLLAFLHTLFPFQRYVICPIPSVLKSRYFQRAGHIAWFTLDGGTHELG